MADRICSIGGNDSDAVMHTVCNVCCSPYKKVESDHGIYGITRGGSAYSDPCGCRRKL